MLFRSPVDLTPPPPPPESGAVEEKSPRGWKSYLPFIPIHRSSSKLTTATLFLVLAFGTNRGKSALRQKALQVLRQRNLYEDQHKQIQQQIWNLEKVDLARINLESCPHFFLIVSLHRPFPSIPISRPAFTPSPISGVLYIVSCSSLEDLFRGSVFLFFLFTFISRFSQ